MCAATVAVAHQAHAGLSYDLRLTDGSHSVTVTAPGTYGLDLWVRASGTNGTFTDDGYWEGFFNLLSQQVDGGGITAGGISAGVVNNDFRSYSGTFPLFINGGGADLNADGVVDWGANSTSPSDPNYMRTRAPGLVLGGGAVGQAVDANTWEMKIASFTVNVNSVGAGATYFSISKPPATIAISTTYALGRVDGATFAVNSLNQQGAYGASFGVAFESPAVQGGPPVSLNYTAGASPSEWTQVANWSANPLSGVQHVPRPIDRAVLSSGVVGIDMGGATNNGPANQGTSSIVLSGAGNLTIQNSSSTNGTLTVSGDSGFILFANNTPNSTLLIQDGPSAKLNVNLTGSGYIDIPSAAASVRIDSAIAGAGKSITKTGSGTLTFGGNNTFTGEFRLNLGNARLTSTGSLAASSINTGGFKNTFDVEGSLSASPSLTQSGTTNFYSQAQTLGSLSGQGTINLAGTALTLNSGTFSGSFAGSGSLVKNTTGTLSLTGLDSLPSGVTVLAGTLSGNISSLRGNIVNNATLICDAAGKDFTGSVSGTGSFQFSSGTLTAASTYTGGTTLRGSCYVSQPYILAPLSTFSIENYFGGFNGLIQDYSQRIGQLSGFGGVTLNGSSNLEIGGNNTSSSYAGNISGSGSITKAGAGDLTLSAQNTYTGPTSVLGGKLILGGGNGSKSFTVASGAMLQITNPAISLTGASVTLDNGAALQLPSSTMTLTGAGLRNNGILSGDIVVSSTSTLSGIGTFNGTVLVQSGGKISPGNSVGSMTINALNLGKTGRFLVDLSDATASPGVGNDTINVNNLLTISAGTLSTERFVIALNAIDANNNPAAISHFDPNQFYHWLIVHTGGGIIGFSADKFTVDASAFLPVTTSSHFSLNQSGTDLYLNYSPVPEPAALSILSLAGLSACGRRRTPRTSTVQSDV